AGYGGDFLECGLGQARQIVVEAGEQLAGKINRAFAPDADAQEDGQQLGIRQCFRAKLEQAFAGSFVFGPVADCHRLECRHHLEAGHSAMSLLAGKRIVLGVTGGVAAYKAAELARLFVKAGARVDVVLTEAGAHFVGAATFQAITGHAVWSDLWDTRMPNGMAHIVLSRGADAILIAPASADTIARLAQGRSDDLLTTLCLARDCPLLVAPAMNRQMWENPATQRNV